MAGSPCDFETVLLTLCQTKIHNYKVNGQKTRWIKALFLYPNLTKTQRASVESKKNISGVIPRTPVKWDGVRAGGEGR